ncbi:MAG: hypothetical protein JST54_28285 [Deltaproteobacteria bacterium]|nr:hypothetical protein [Deltaproteobacteria bacterium]
MRRGVFTLAWLLATGCGAYYPSASGSTGGGTEQPFSVNEIGTTPIAAPDAGAPIEHDLAGDVQLVAAGAEYVVAETDQGPFRVVGTDDPVSMAYVDASGTSALSVSALVPRQPAPPNPSDPTPTTGVLALARQGLLVDFTDYFESAGLPLSSPQTASGLDDVGTGDSEVIWTGIPGGATRIGRLSSDTYSIGGETSAPSAVLQLDQTLALLAFGGKVYDLHTDSKVADALDHDFTLVHAMTRGTNADTAFLATSDGLYERTSTGPYDHYLAGQDISGVGYDPLNGLYFTTSTALLLLKGDGTMLNLGALPAGVHPLAIDGFGDVWVGAGKSLLQFHVGTSVTYTNDVKPFLAANCYTCHVSQLPGTPNDAPKLPFDDYTGTRGLAPDIISRVQGQGGLMPPAPPVGNGPLQPSQYGVVIRWVQSGELQ